MPMFDINIHQSTTQLFYNYPYSLEGSQITDIPVVEWLEDLDVVLLEASAVRRPSFVIAQELVIRLCSQLHHLC